MESTLSVSAATFAGLAERVKHVLDSSASSSSLSSSASSSAITELESTFTKTIDVVHFTRVLEYCLSNGLATVKQDPCLDITFSNVTLPKGHVSMAGVRVSVSGEDAIQKYFATGAIETLPQTAVKVIRKTRVRQYPQLDVSEYDVRFNLRTEDPITMSVFDPKTLKTLPKTFRLKTRASFLSHDGLFRYDFTKVHMSDGTAQHASSSGLIRSKERYEVEIELMQPSVMQSAKGLLRKMRSMSPEDIAKALLGHVGVLRCAMTQSPCLIGSKDQADILSAYEKLTGSARFGGAQPVTLEKKHVVRPEHSLPNVPTILRGYSVTLKYDGERHLLFIAPPHGRLTLIARSRYVTTVKYLGIMRPRLVNTLIDGEYLPYQLSFAAFDAYYVRGEDVRAQPLRKRLEHLEKTVREINASQAQDGFEVTAKHFVFGDDDEMKSACAELITSIDEGNVEFETDGLIFTPDTGVGEGVTLKWKPPENNTIDFLLSVTHQQAGTKTVFGLYCGFKQTRHASITPMDFLKDGGTAAKDMLKKSVYIAKRFTLGATEMTVLHAPGDRVAKCENGDVIDDLTIAECRFDERIQSWIPVRVRFDKVQEMFASRRITANNYDTALSVWRSISRPVTKQSIAGGDEDYRDDNDDYDDDVYYARETNDDLSGSHNMRRFHNFFVKQCSLLGFAVKSALEPSMVSVLDVGCGKGGDIPKYLQLGVRRVLGVDLSVSNIRDATDGAYARLSELIGNREDVDYVFLSLDASKDFSSPQSAVDACVTEEDKSAARILWGVEDGNVRWKGFATERTFDVATLMFDVHYFFDEKTSLSTLLKTLNQMVGQGGHVVGACLDGQSVRDALGKSSMLRGKSSSGKIVYQIEKMYEEQDEDERENPYGKRVGVYVESINKVIPEYLVDVAELEKRFVEHGFDKVHVDGFRSIYNTVLEDHESVVALGGAGLKRSKLERELECVKSMTDVERDYSFMHCFFIFRKR